MIMVGAMTFLERQREKRRVISDANKKLDSVQRTLADAIEDFRPRRFTAEDLEDEISGSRRRDPGHADRDR